MSDARKSWLDTVPWHVATTWPGAMMACVLLSVSGPVLANAAGGPVVCSLNGRTEAFAERLAVPVVEGLTRSRFEGSGRVERVVLIDSQREIVRVEFNPDGRLRQLRCSSRSRVAEGSELYGWSGLQEVGLFDAEGRKRAAVTHHEGQRVGLMHDSTRLASSLKS